MKFRIVRAGATLVVSLLSICSSNSFAGSVGTNSPIVENTVLDVNLGGECTLCNAIEGANTDTSVGGCARGNGKDTIFFLPVGDADMLNTF